MPNPPKLDPQRGTRGRGITWLPARGREGEVPPWPLGDEMSGAEAQAWAELWATPQAVAWEKLGWVRTVGRYCRLMVRAEAHDSYAALHAQATALEDRLGLTPKSMRLLLWQVASDEVAERRAGRPAEASEDELSLRRRLIAGDAGGVPAKAVSGRRRRASG